MITSGIAITVTGSPITNHQSVRLSIRTRNGPSFRRTTTTTTSARLGRLFPVVCITNQHYYHHHHHHHPPPRVLKGKDTLRQRSAWWTVDGGRVDSGITMKEGRRAREIRAAPTRLSCQSQWTNGSGRQSLFEREGLGVRFCVVI